MSGSSRALARAGQSVSVHQGKRGACAGGRVVSSVNVGEWGEIWREAVWWRAAGMAESMAESILQFLVCLALVFTVLVKYYVTKELVMVEAP